MSTQFLSCLCLDHMMLQPRRLLAAYGTGMISENEREANPGPTSDVDST